MQGPRTPDGPTAARCCRFFAYLYPKPGLLKINRAESMISVFQFDGMGTKLFHENMDTFSSSGKEKTTKIDSARNYGTHIPSTEPFEVRSDLK